MTTDRAVDDQERADFLAALRTRRSLLCYTVRDLSDEQARERTTVSALCLGGLIKHVTAVEHNWGEFIVNGPPDDAITSEASMKEHQEGFQMGEDETLAEILADYAEVARATDELVASLPSFDASQPLPAAPWFEPGARWSARQVLLHVIAETAQHAGHADILRESLDGAKTMG